MAAKEKKFCCINLWGKLLSDYVFYEQKQGPFLTWSKFATF